MLPACNRDDGGELEWIDALCGCVLVVVFMHHGWVLSHHGWVSSQCLLCGRDGVDDVAMCNARLVQCCVR
jgi:hypothetical protein